MLIDRPTLTARMHQASPTVIALAAPRGYGKTALLNAYQRQHPSDQVVSVLCLTDDLRAAHLAAALTHRVQRSVPGLFSGVTSEYHALKGAGGTLRSTPDLLAEAVALDLSQAPGPLTFVIDGLAGPEQLRFVTELARRCDTEHRFVLSGYEPLLTALRLTEVPHLALTKADLAFTPEECTALGIPWGEHRGWPAAVIKAAAPDHLSLSEYLHHLIALLGDDERALLPAALLEVWLDPSPTPGAAALGLTGRWVQRFRNLGWPLLSTVSGDGVQPHPLMRDAMLSAMSGWDDLSAAQDRLARALTSVAPLRSLDLQRSAPARLITARQELASWVAEGQWTQIRAHLGDHLNELSAEELSEYARASLNLAHTAQALADVFAVLRDVKRLGASEPAISLLIAEGHLRLGHTDAAIAVLDNVRGRQPSADAQLAILGRQALAQLQAGRAAEVLFEFRRYTQLELEQHLEALVTQAAACLATGAGEQALSQALNAHLSYLYQPALLGEQLSAAFVLIDLLTDLGRPDEAELLLTRLPRQTGEGGGGWLAARTALSQGRLALRQGAHGEAQALYAGAAKLALGGAHADLGVSAEAGLLYVALRSGDLSSARVHRNRAAALSRTGPSSAAYLHLTVALAAYDDPEVAALLLARGEGAPGESVLIAVTELRRAGHAVAPLDPSRYGAGVWNTWLPDGERALTAHHLSVYLLRSQPQVLLDGRTVLLAPKPRAVLAYLAVQRQVTRQQLRRDLFDASSSPDTYINKCLSNVKAAIRDLVGEPGLALILTQQHRTQTHSLHPRLSVSLDLHEILTCPLERVTSLYNAPLTLAETEVWFRPLLNRVRDALEARLNTADWAQARPVAQHLARVDGEEPRWAAMLSTPPGRGPNGGPAGHRNS